MSYQAAGNAVKQAADALVQSTQKSAVFEVVDVQIKINKKITGSLAQEIQAQADILKKEKELEEARRKLAQIRRYRYREEEDDD